MKSIFKRLATPEKKSKTKGQARTPPVTPSPTKDDADNSSKYQVRVIPTSASAARRSSGAVSLSESSGSAGSESSSTDSGRNSILLGNGSSYSNKKSDHDNSSPLGDSDILQNVLGMTCGYPSLSPIPENKIFQWGVAPSYDSDDIDDIDGEYDDYEVVLDDEHNLKRSGNQIVNADPKNVIIEAGTYGNKFGYCQPCNKNDNDGQYEYETEDEGEDVNQRGNGNTIVNQMNFSVRNPNPVQGVKKKSTFKKKVKTFMSKKKMKTLFQAKLHKNQNSEGGVLGGGEGGGGRRRIRRSTVDDGDGVSSGKTDRSQKDHSRQPQQKPHRTSKESWKCVHDKSSQRVYFYHTGTRKTTWTKPDNFQEWRVCTDPKSSRIYYANILTRETRWEKPSLDEGFLEWREVMDEKSGRYYYYNIFTKATTWEKPQELCGIVKKEEKRQSVGGAGNGSIRSEAKQLERSFAAIHDATVQSTGSSSKATRSRSTDDVIIIASSDKSSYTPTSASPHDNRRKEETISKNDNESNGVKKDRGMTAKEAKYFEAEKNEVYQSDIQALDTQAKKVCQGVLHQPEARNALKSVRESSAKPLSPIAEPPVDTPKRAECFFKESDSHKLLAKLLSDFCPDEKENNEQLLEKCQGEEVPIIKAIEALLNETPFDELRLAIFNYVKATLAEMGEEPYDEKKRVGKEGIRKYATPSSHSLGVNFSAGYSITSRELSHVTGKSDHTNLTEQTNRINNTSNRVRSFKTDIETLKDRKNLNALQMRIDRMLQEDSFDISYDDLADTASTGDDVQVVLDMQEMKNDLSRSDEKSTEDTAEKKRHTSKKDGGDKIRDKKSIPKESEKMATTTVAVTSKSPQTSKPPADCSSTIESAYAADKDDESDHDCWEGIEDDEDDVSALSDSFGPSIRKRYLKEKKILTRKEESLRKKSKKKNKGKSRHRGRSAPKVGKVIGVKTTIHKKTSKPEPEYTPNTRIYDNDDDLCGEMSSIGYEELPRRLQESTRQTSDNYSWDDDTVTTNESH